MPNKFFLGFFLLVFSSSVASAQDVQANIQIIATRIPTTVDHKIFRTLQTALTNFVNGRKWSNETFASNERINCNLVFNLSQSLDNNEFNGTLTVQASRAIYNSAYQSPLINYLDENVIFRYVEYQSLDFSESRVQGNEPVAANLTAVIAYYIYTILGLEFDSYSLRGGDVYFQKAENIVNNSPDATEIIGWRAFDGLRNRYWLMENLTNSKYALVHDALYNYYRLGLDQMYDKEIDGRNAILNTLNQLNTVNTETPNTMIIQFFFIGKGIEIAGIFKKASFDEKQRALDVLTKIDIGNANLYKQYLQ
jgi:Domain of unknown function (DUF4835)